MANGSNPVIAFERVQLISALRHAQQARCSICGKWLPAARTVSEQANPNRCSIEHVFPKTLGGHDGIGNTLVAHGRCNVRKGGRWPTMGEIAMLEEINAILGYATRYPASYHEEIAIGQAEANLRAKAAHGAALGVGEDADGA